MLNWANQFSVCCFLDNNHYDSPHHSNECLMGAGVNAKASPLNGSFLAGLKDFLRSHNDWIFGHLSYDLKNEIENLHSAHVDNIGFSPLFFYIPDYVLKMSESQLQIGSLGDDHALIYKNILEQPVSLSHHKQNKLIIKQRIKRPEYLDTIKSLQGHIRRGDCYEINFCQEFYAEEIDIDPGAVFSALSRFSPNPFSAYYKNGRRYLLCASPERYLKKTGREILSQPIKGTLHRVLGDKEKDKLQIEKLLSSSKERSENVMVVDLVRNDLSRVCKVGSVRVDELFGIYTFPQVHQMVSTISGELKAGMDFTEIIRSSFPMGSMTGAPKRKVMELIERYEKSHRGLFSGAVGYITPDDDFDFNVVIRSILYNGESRYLSFPAGSAITYYSDPEAEYAECLLKANAILQVLEGA